MHKPQSPAKEESALSSRPRSRRNASAWVVATLAGLLLAYPLSLGPVLWTFPCMWIPSESDLMVTFAPFPPNRIPSAGGWNREEPSLLAECYRPLAILCIHSETARELLRMYVQRGLPNEQVQYIWVKVPLWPTPLYKRQLFPDP
ncbi:hypothetical protein DB346_02415 [Verrucomicrobia bacterium LW23]|nr:hypothetical protein DB346_02415 [Verrucomicrobia bacterium LW23]